MAQNQNQDGKPIARKLSEDTPKYSLVPIIQTTRIDPGDKLQVQFFLSGYGPVDRNKLFLPFHHPEILPEEEQGYMTNYVAGNIDVESNRINALVTGEHIFEEDINPRTKAENYALYAVLNTSYFVDNPETADSDFPKEHPMNSIPQLLTERLHDNNAPLKLVLETSENATPGDYEIPYVFTYGYENELQQSTGVINIHINNKREQLEPIPTAAGIIAVLIALISLVYQAGIFSVLWEWVLQVI